MQHRYTVTHEKTFELRLAELWTANHHVQEAMDELEPVLRTIPEQAGREFMAQGRSFWHIAHQMIEIVYEIQEDDCRVRLIDVRLRRHF